MNCIIIDDEQFSIDLIENYVKQIPGISLIYSTTNPIEGIDFLRNNTPDIIFLDINMEELSGLELIQIIGAQQKVIFISGEPNYAHNAFDEGAVDYLLKPISFPRFLKAVNKVKEKKKAVSSFIFLKNNGVNIRIDTEDIVYLEGMRAYIAFYIKNKPNPILVNLTFAQVQELLPYPSFVRIHHGYLIALKKIETFNIHEVNMIWKLGVKTLPLSLKYKKYLQAAIQGIS